MACKVCTELCGDGKNKLDSLVLWEASVNPILTDSFPRIRRLAKVFCCIPATSVPSERTFRRCSDVITKKRNRILGGVVDQLVVLAMNRELAMELILKKWHSRDLRLEEDNE